MKVQKVDRTEWPDSVHTLKLKVTVSDPVSSLPVAIYVELKASAHNISDRDLAHPVFAKLAAVVEAAVIVDADL